MKVSSSSSFPLSDLITPTPTTTTTTTATTTTITTTTTLDSSTTTPPDVYLSQFLNSLLPPEAIFQHLTNLRLSPIKSPVVIRRKVPPTNPTQIKPKPKRIDDFADWTEAHTESFRMSNNSGGGLLEELDDAPAATLSSLSEVFLARWLSLAGPHPRPNVLLRTRQGCGLQCQKRHKGTDLSEWSANRRAVANEQSNSDPLTGNRLNTNRTEAIKLNSSPTSTRRLQKPLQSVGGASRILCHAAAVCQDTTYVFGGLTIKGCSDELWSFQPPEPGWKQVEVRSRRAAGEVLVPSNRYNHSLISWRNQLVLFGGDGGPGYLDDLWYFDVDSQYWDRISLEQEQEGKRPGARAGHSAALYNDSMIVFGGWRGCDGFCDVWACNLEAREWQLLGRHYSRWAVVQQRTSRDGSVVIENGVEVEIPQPRQWHVSDIFGDYLYVHGGCGLSGALRHVWRFHLLERVWEFVPTRGREPAARCRHSAVALDNRRWAILGGKDTLGTYFGDIYILDTVEAYWQPVSLFSPCVPTLPQEEETWWNEPNIIRDFPFLHCQAIAYDRRRDMIIVIGGCDGDAAASDSTILLRRFPAAAVLFDEWSHRRPRRGSRRAPMDLPEFIHRHPDPFSREILKYL